MNPFTPLFVTRASRTKRRSHCGRTEINLGLSDSIDIIMSEIFLAWTAAVCVASDRG